MQVGLKVALHDANRLDVGNVAQERQVQDILHVFLALNRIVEEVEEQSQAQGHGESADDTTHKDQGFIGAHWLERRLHSTTVTLPLTN